MPRFDSRFIDAAFEPAGADVAARMVADDIGADTAAVLTRRDTLKADAAALRALGTLPVELYDLLDAMIAAAFDA